MQDKSARAPGLVKVTAKGKRGYYTPLADHLPLSATVVLSPPLATTQCTLASFPGPMLAGECTLAGTRLTCK